jgi:hypothetical protein
MPCGKYMKGRPKAKTGSKTVAKKMDDKKRKGAVAKKTRRA